MRGEDAGEESEVQRGTAGVVVDGVGAGVRGGEDWGVEGGGGVGEGGMFSFFLCSFRLSVALVLVPGWSRVLF